MRSLARSRRRSKAGSCGAITAPDVCFDGAEGALEGNGCGRSKGMREAYRLGFWRPARLSRAGTAASTRTRSRFSGYLHIAKDFERLAVQRPQRVHGVHRLAQI